MRNLRGRTSCKLTKGEWPQLKPGRDLGPPQLRLFTQTLGGPDVTGPGPEGLAFRPLHTPGTVTPGLEGRACDGLSHLLGFFRRERQQVGLVQRPAQDPSHHPSLEPPLSPGRHPLPRLYPQDPGRPRAPPHRGRRGERWAGQSVRSPRRCPPGVVSGDSASSAAVCPGPGGGQFI